MCAIIVAAQLATAIFTLAENVMWTGLCASHFSELSNPLKMIFKDQLSDY